MIAHHGAPDCGSARLAANRTNAARSAGTRTRAGEAAVARNTVGGMGRVLAGADPALAPESLRWRSASPGKARTSASRRRRSVNSLGRIDRDDEECRIDSDRSVTCEERSIFS
jgi:hypothetical protein